MTLDLAQASLAHTRAPRRVCQQRVDGASQVVRVIVTGQQPIDALVNHPRERADARPDHRFATRPGLSKDDTESLVTGGQREHVTRVKQIGLFSIRELAHHKNLRALLRGIGLD